jgi:hypothetical protein
MPMSLVWVVYLREQTIPLRRKDTENSKRFMENLLVGQEKKQRQEAAVRDEREILSGLLKGNSFFQFSDECGELLLGHA